MIKKFVVILTLILAGISTPIFGFAQSEQEGLDPGHIPAEIFYRGQVVKVISEEYQEVGEDRTLNQTVLVRITSGEESGKELEIINNGIFTLNGGKGVKEGDKIVVYRVDVQGEATYYIADTYRLPALALGVGLFFLVAIMFGRWKGFTSIIGLLVSILVIAKLIVPQIIAGQNPVLISLLGAVIIALVSIYISHGFNKRTSIALAGTLITLGLAALMSYAFVLGSRLFGVGSEEAFYLQFSSIKALNLQGLLLGGIILGALGVLDDITTTQSATVEELKKANQSLSFKELYKRGLSVGREHIASLVNTLFLAYVGAALPLFLLFTTTVSQPLWVTLNSEQIGEEIVRTMVGSIALILAVPITTFLAAYYFSKQEHFSEHSSPGHTH